MNKLTKTGFTLIELLLYFSIVGTLLLVLTTFFGMSVESRIKAQSISEVDQQGAYAMDQITQSIRNATSITTPIAGITSSSLALVVPFAAASPTTFSLTGTTLQITEAALNSVALTNSNVQVTALSFTNLTRAGTPGIVQVSITLKRVNSSGRNEYDYQKTFTSSAELSW